jgi:hypothetical protein
MLECRVFCLPTHYVKTYVTYEKLHQNICTILYYTIFIFCMFFMAAILDLSC